MRIAPRSLSAIIVLVVIMLVPFSAATSREIYMAPDGDDTNGDGSFNNPYRTLKMCSMVVAPGDSIILKYGVYPAETSMIGVSTQFHGTPGNYITIIGQPSDVDQGNIPIYDGLGGSTGSCFSISAHYASKEDASYIIIKDIIFRNAEVMGINLDDGGTFQREEPAHHIIIDSCYFLDINPAHTQGSGIKFAGVDTFEIVNCTFDGVGHNGIDFVGCHEGIVRDCVFKNNLGPNGDDGFGITCKGGSKDITVERCVFRDLFLYGVQLGQTTGDDFFRPPCGELDGDGEIMNYEAKNCNVYSCLFINVGTPIRWDNAIGGKVYNNTFYCPKNDPLRPDGENGGIRHIVTIHQDNTNCGGTPIAYCQGGEFRNNISYFGYTNYPVYVQSPYTLPETFIFSNNLWYCWVDESNSMPDWEFLAGYNGCPQHFEDQTGDPLFTNPTPWEPIDFVPQDGSPAKGFGLILDEILYDILNNRFADPPIAQARTIGALECVFSSGGYPGQVQGEKIEP